LLALNVSGLQQPGLLVTGRVLINPLTGANLSGSIRQLWIAQPAQIIPVLLLQVINGATVFFSLSFHQSFGGLNGIGLFGRNRLP
jgi:hypothetical protein